MAYQPALKQVLPEYQIDYVKLHKENRTRVINRFKDELKITTGVLFVKGGEIKTIYDSDTEISFRQESNFQYLFGASEGDCEGAIDLATGKATLFVPKLAEEYAVWMGEIHPCDFFTKKYSVDATHYTEESESIVKALQPDCVYTISSVPNLPQWLSTLKTNHADKLKYVLDETRVIKSEEELNLLRYINKISSFAHIETMKACNSSLFQYELEAVFLHLAYSNGRCRHAAYGCICATGKNSATLHYPENDQKMKENEIALMDMGAQYHGYCSDITCSYPVNGKFSEEQKIIYSICYDSQLAVMKTMKPGIQWEEMHKLAARVICEGLVKHGFLYGEIDELVANHVPALFFPHGLGHMLGLDTHDAGGFPPGVTKLTDPGIKNLRARRVLEKGMVITVEPGVYFIDALLLPAMKDEKLKKFLNVEKISQYMNFGGVRIEDDVIVTENGMENMTLCPRTIDDIEEVMLKKNSKKFEEKILGN